MSKRRSNLLPRYCHAGVRGPRIQPFVRTIACPYCGHSQRKCLDGLFITCAKCRKRVPVSPLLNKVQARAAYYRKKYPKKKVDLT